MGKNSSTNIVYIVCNSPITIIHQICFIFNVKYMDGLQAFSLPLCTFV